MLVTTDSERHPAIEIRLGSIIAFQPHGEFAMVALSHKLADDKAKPDAATQSQYALDDAYTSIERTVFWGMLFVIVSAVLGMLW